MPAAAITPIATAPPAPFGTGETGHAAGAGGEGEAVDSGDRTVALGEFLCFDHVWHARSGRLAGASVTVTGFAGWSCPAVR
jgi:hypothetical protein